MYLILVVFIFLMAVTFAWAGRTAPWVPTRKGDVERFLRLADVRAGDKMYDLGCGDGRLVAAAARRGALAVGFEISLFPYFIAKMRGFFLKNNWFKSERSLRFEPKNYKVKFQDFWKADLSEADVVYFFLMPKVYPKLKQKFEKELKKGARVIAYVWPIDGWQALKVDKRKKKPDIYFYHV